MKKINFLIALFIGAIAGMVDVIPMILQDLNLYACSSAFIHWLALGTIIPYVAWNVKPWLKGLVIAELTSLPIAIIVAEKEPISIIPILLFSAVLGILVGIAGNKFMLKN